MSDIALVALLACYPVAFIVIGLVVIRAHRRAAAHPERPVADPLALVRSHHPAVAAAAAGHPEFSPLYHEERQNFDCALAALLGMAERGVVRLDIDPGAPTEAPAGTPKRSEAYEAYACYILLRGDAAPEGALDGLALDLFLPDGAGRVALADLMTSFDRHWGPAKRRLAAFSRELRDELEREGIVGGSYRPAKVLRGAPFWIAVAWAVAGLVAWGVTHAGGGPVTVALALIVIGVPWVGLAIPATPMLTDEGADLGRAALTVRDTVDLGIRCVSLEQAGLGRDEAVRILKANGSYDRADRELFDAWHHDPAAWASMFEMLIASGALRTGDGPDALAIIGRRVSELASVAPEDVAAQPPLEALMPWFKIVFADGGEVQPAALALHDLGIFKTGDYDT